jgi:cation diffusion facilitator family transporter
LEIPKRFTSSVMSSFGGFVAAISTSPDICSGAYTMMAHSKRRNRPCYDRPPFGTAPSTVSFGPILLSVTAGSIRKSDSMLLANFGIAIAKTWGAWFTGSGSMLAEAIHSYADTGNQVLLFLGLSQSQRPADARHPLGYGKLSYFWAFIVAIMLFSLGGIFSIYEGIHKLQQPEPLQQIWVGLLILAVAIVLESLSLWGALGQIRRIRATKSLRDWLRTTRNAELVVVLGEDIAALAGLVLAFVFLGGSGLTGDPFYDALGSISIGIVLIVVSVFVAA